MQHDDGSDATVTADGDVASPAESDRVTRTRTRTSDSPEAGGTPRALASGDRLPAPLQYRDPARYEIVAEHGRGGLGRVFRARDKELGRDVALKELLSRGSRTELRFFREALITARLEHPGIVPVHEAGRWPDGTPFYAMKLVAGRPLKALIEACKTLEERLALLPHVIAVADAIAYAHDRKIIHRDLKPSNIIVGDFGETVVIDWGLAKDISGKALVDDANGDGHSRISVPSSDGVTVAGSVVGTPAYMSPEQAHGEPVDERADVYSIGAILHELCTGHPAHSSQRSLLGVRRIPPDLAVIANRATDAVDVRYPNAAELANDLRAFDAGVRIRSRRYSVWSLVGLWTRRNRGVALTLALALLAGAILGALSIAEILDQRNRATSALAFAKRAQSSAEDSARTARQERDKTRLALAKSLLGSDPTEAAALLDTMAPLALSAALLRSRANAAGVAVNRWRLGPKTIRRMEFDPATRSVAAVLDDGSAHRLSLATGKDEVVARDLGEPAFVAAFDGEWLYAARSSAGISIRSAPTSRPIVSIDNETVPPDNLLKTPDGWFLLTQQGRLIFAPMDGGTPSTLADDIKGVARFDDEGIIACTGGGELRTIRLAEPLRSIGRCADQGNFALLEAVGRNYAVSVSDDTLAVSRAQRAERLRIPLGNNSDIALAASGLLTAIDRDGRSYYQRGPGQPWISKGRDQARATVTSASGSLAAWGYSDGSVRILDADSSQTWDFTGHDGVVVGLAIVPDERLVISAGGTEVRAWHLDSVPNRQVVALGCQSMNLVSIPGGSRVLSDCQNGTVSILEEQQPTVRAHQHNSLAFSVAWWGDEACSGGWDGHVICTNIRTRQNRTIASHRSRTRWLAANADALYYSVADGTVWRVATGETTPSKIFEHTSEFARIALHPSNTLLAAGAEDGSVFVYDSSTGRTTRSVDGHRGRVTQLEWMGDQLVTSSADGSLRAWTTSMDSTPLRAGPDPIRQFARTELGWFVVQKRNQIVALDTRVSDTPLQLSNSTAALTSSPDERYLAWLAGDSLTILDSRIHGVATLRLPSTPELPCVAFGTGAFLHYCRTTEEIATVDVSRLEYVRFTMTPKTSTEANPQ